MPILVGDVLDDGPELQLEVILVFRFEPDSVGRPPLGALGDIRSVDVPLALAFAQNGDGSFFLQVGLQQQPQVLAIILMDLALHKGKRMQRAHGDVTNPPFIRHHLYKNFLLILLVSATIDARNNPSNRLIFKDDFNFGASDSCEETADVGSGAGCLVGEVVAHQSVLEVGARVVADGGDYSLFGEVDDGEGI